MVQNSVGRLVPNVVNNIRQVPFKGVGKFSPDGKKAAPQIHNCNEYPLDGNKVVGSLKEALMKAGLSDGMTVSNHHHFRNGDLVMNQVFDIAVEMGVKGLRWFPSAAFPCHEPVIDHINNGILIGLKDH